MVSNVSADQADGQFRQNDERSRSHSRTRDRRPRPNHGRWAQFQWFLKMQAKYIGPGIAMSVAYLDPGNWSTDLAAGSQFGYSLLFVILLAGIFGIILQVLSLRMGIVCDRDLAVMTREWVLNLGKDKKEYRAGAGNTARSLSKAKAPEELTSRARWAQRGRITLLSGLWLVSEGAIIATELAELPGSAIALNLLFPSLPLWAGVLITSADVFLILFLYRPDTKSLRIFEFLIGILVLVIISSLVALVVKVDPYWPDLFYGYVPSAKIVDPQALYVAIGIIGATCMIHSLYLGSHFAMFERERITNKEITSEETLCGDDGQGCMDQQQSDTQQSRMEKVSRWLIRWIPGLDAAALGLRPTSRRGALHDSSAGVDDDHADGGDNERPRYMRRPSRSGTITAALPARDRHSPETLKRRILHSTIDISVSMVLFAITTNSALLIIAAQAFYFGIGQDPGARGDLEGGDLFETFKLLQEKLNHTSAILFAIGLLAAAQSASITVTLAGQITSEGMIKWKTNPFVRRVVTRIITLIPSLVVAIAVGREGLDKMLVASQVALSMALPFVLVPLLAITGSRNWMNVELSEDVDDDGDDGDRGQGAVSEGVNEFVPSRDVEGLGEQPDSAQVVPAPQSRRTWTQTLRRTVLSLNWWTRGSGRVMVGGTSESNNCTLRSAESNADINSVTSTAAPVKTMHFASGWVMVAITSAMFVVIVLSDGFVVVTTILGTGGA